MTTCHWCYRDFPGFSGRMDEMNSVILSNSVLVIMLLRENYLKLPPLLAKSQIQHGPE